MSSGRPDRKGVAVVALAARHRPSIAATDAAGNRSVRRAAGAGGWLLQARPDLVVPQGVEIVRVEDAQAFGARPVL